LTDAGIEELCSEFNSSKAVLVTYKKHYWFWWNGKDMTLHLFRILQEHE
jgi:hypothetical protein